MTPKSQLCLTCFPIIFIYFLVPIPYGVIPNNSLGTDCFFSTLESPATLTHALVDMPSQRMYDLLPLENITPDSPPQITILEPTNHSYFYKDKIHSILIRGISYDDKGIERVEIQVDSGEWTIAQGTNNWTILLDSEEMTIGVHLIKARSFDGSQYSGLEQIRIRIVKTEPPRPNYFLINLIIITILITVISIIGWIILVYRKR